MNESAIQIIKKWTKSNLPSFHALATQVYVLLITLKHGRARQYIHRNFLHNGIFLYEHELPSASLFPKKIIDKTIEMFHPKSVLELGCGTGKALDYFYGQGIDVIGVEGSKVAISRAINKRLIKRHNLEKELNLRRKFELIWSFEFVEHIHPKYADNLLRTFSNHSDTVVMSAARPSQGGGWPF